MTRITEQRDVQDALINHLMGIGWNYLAPAQVVEMRAGDEAEPFLPELMRGQLLALNPWLTGESADQLIRRLRLLKANLSGNESYVQGLRGDWTGYDPVEKRERNLTLIDYDDLTANRFHFTQELPFMDRDRRRMDMVLWVNGLPVTVIENKSPTVQDAHFQAFEQVQETYTERIPEFLKYPPLMAAANMRLHYAPTWNPDPKAMNRWKVDGKDYGLERLATTFFDQTHLLNILRDYIIFYRADDQTRKFVLRPHQMRGAQKVVNRVLAAEADSGLHWHTQGSGKTLTMIVSAHMLRRDLSARGENPTLLIVLDRLELEGQMVQNLEAFGFPAVVRAERKAHLRELLADDYRGLIVTLIHKFDRMPKNQTDRSNVVILIDEAHRSQEGDLGVYMRAALPNAYYFGFTGTPIDRGKVGRGTFETFGKADPDGYQDKYSMDESIEDGTTVPLYYTLAPSELQVDRDTLEEEFYKVVEEEGAASIEAVNAILRKADKLNAVLKADDRVQAVAAHIAEHFQKNVEPLGFKAFVVTVDREACALYKQALDQYLPADYSRVVYTAYHKDGDLMRQYHIDQDEEKRIRRLFRDPAELPKILIVTEKLLTGFDAPVLYCMYLDKPLKDHTLLQAIARVNRPYQDKDSGLIVDYISIFENLQRALAFDSESVATGLIDLKELRKRFAKLLTEIQAMLAPIDPQNEIGRSERLIDYFFDEERREDFVKLYKSLQSAFEILSPEPFLVDYLDAYALIVQIYQVVYNYFDPEAHKRRLEREILKKTDQLIREHVTVEGHIDTLRIYPITKDLARVIEADDVSEQVKVTNLYRSLMVHIEENQEEQPHLISIGEQVEAVIARLRERQISVQAALEQLENQADNVVAADEEQDQIDLAGGAFALYWVLKGQGYSGAEEIARELDQMLVDNPGWAYNRKMEGHVRLSMYKSLRAQRPEATAAEMTPLVDNVLRMARMMGR